METQVHLPDTEPPATIREVVAALKKQKLKAKHDKATWGDWINFVEGAEGEDDVLIACIAAFRKLGWHGEDADGTYPL